MQTLRIIYSILSVPEGSKVLVVLSSYEKLKQSLQELLPLIEAYSYRDGVCRISGRIIEFRVDGEESTVRKVKRREILSFDELSSVVCIGENK